METKHINHNDSESNSAQEKLKYQPPEINILAVNKFLKFGLYFGTDANSAGPGAGPIS